ncbi:hypothetical protein [Nannocystis punicea]|nr:hypothetical protein [Nannocystis poenicansa]WAS99477.1 hypothetical protein O0S08_25410 [Nannocystis poenicansa]
MASRVTALLATLALLSVPASAAAGVQAPPSPHVSSSGSAELAPMPATAPIQGNPPDLTQPASVPAWQPPEAGVATPAVPAATGPSGPAPENMSPKPDKAKGEPKRGPLWTEGQPLIVRGSKVGAYIAPTFKLTGFGRSPGLMLGADFAVIVNERFMFGAAGTALATPLPAQRTDDRTFNMRTQYAGITLAVALLQVRFFSLQIGALIGGGRVCLNDERLDRCVNRAAMFVAEPELGLSFALTRVLRLVLSGGYRFAVAQPWSGPSDRILSGLTGTLGLRLGKF